MAQGLNKVMLLGNVGQQPELKFTQSGTAVLNLSMATGERFKDKNGNWQDRAEWHRVIIWGKRGEGLSKVLAKGSKIFVEGKLQTRSWEDKNGQKRYTTEIVASNVLFAGSYSEPTEPANGPDDEREPAAVSKAKAQVKEAFPDPDDDDIPF